MELEEYADILKRGDISEISERSLNKVITHYRKINATSFGFITTEDATQFSDIQEDIANLGLGYFKLKCIWETDRDMPWYAMGLFVLNIAEKDMNNLYKKFDKSLIVFENADSSYDINALYTHMKKHKGENFTFRGFQWIPMGMLTNMALEHHLKT